MKEAHDSKPEATPQPAVGDLLEVPKFKPAMPVEEFKLWFAGFQAALDGQIPNRKQWNQLRRKVNELQPQSEFERRRFAAIGAVQTWGRA